MLTLFFGDPVAALTTLLVLSLMGSAALSIRRRADIARWGRRTALFVLAGTAVSALAAARDAYATAQALFAMDSAQSTVCSIAGGAIFLIGLAGIFLRKQPARRFCFFAVSALFVVQVAVVEASRLARFFWGAA